MRKLLWATAASTLVLVAVECSVPTPPELGNAAVVRAFDSDTHVDAVLHRACADCHSNETKIPWFGRSGPVAWVIRRNVEKAQARLNFSEHSSLSASEREKIIDAVGHRSMPPKAYVFLYPEAKLSEKDMEILKAWARR
jgi:Haem-binding domain